MSASEILSRAAQELQDDVSDGDELLEAEREATIPSAADQFMFSDGSGPVDALDVSSVPVLDDSAVSSAHSIPEGDAAEADFQDVNPSGKKNPVSSPAGTASVPDSGHNSSTGTLVFIIRVLLFSNFFVSSSFFIYLL